MSLLFPCFGRCSCYRQGQKPYALLAFFFNIPSSQVCFGTALQKEKNKRSQGLKLTDAFILILLPKTWQGREMGRGKSNIKKK